MLIRVGKPADVAAGQMRAFSAEGIKVSVANVGGTYYAFDDRCTHQGCSLSTGTLDGATVTCPCHGSEFDVRSGAVLEGPADDPVGSWVVEVQGDDLLIGPPA